MQIKMRIKSRCLLILLLIASQVGCLAFGFLWGGKWLHTAFAQVVNSRVQAEGRALAYELASQVADLELKDIAPGTAGWMQLQQLCAQASVPYDGFACVIRRDTGSLLCHPQLAENRELRKHFPGRVTLQTKHASAPILTLVQQAEAQGQHLVAGLANMNHGTQVLTCCNLPLLNAILIIHQSHSKIQANIDSFIRPVAQIGYVLVAFMLGWMAILTCFLCGRYEDSLAEATANLEKKVGQRTRALLRTRNAVIFGLGKLADSRDQDTGKHLESIRSYVTVLASELAKNHPEIDHQYVTDLAVASSLHDIGKVGIPDAILFKPGSLSTDERHVIQMHTVLGSECLAAIQRQLGDDDFLELAQEIARAHHEHWDGSGYPNGLNGGSIPLAARIVALADVYDALTSSRPYKGPCSHAEACERIVSLYGKQFDPEVVEAFIAREQDFSRICQSSIESPPDDSLLIFKSVKMLVEARQSQSNPPREKSHRIT